MCDYSLELTASRPVRSASALHVHAAGTGRILQWLLVIRLMLAPRRHPTSPSRSGSSEGGRLERSERLYNLIAVDEGNELAPFH
jgi:hypothetical protein